MKTPRCLLPSPHPPPLLTSTRPEPKSHAHPDPERGFHFQRLLFCTQGKAQDCKAIPRRAVRRCITNNYSPSDRRNDTQNGDKTRRYRNLQSATMKRHFPHLECGRAKCLQIEFGGAKPRQSPRITFIFNERAFESINHTTLR